MIFSRIGSVFRQVHHQKNDFRRLAMLDSTIYTKTGGVRPEPHRTRFGIFRIFLVVIPGLLIGAAISKNIANFLEENELFVPSDDDDDDD